VEARWNEGTPDEVIPFSPGALSPLDTGTTADAVRATARRPGQGAIIFNYLPIVVPSVTQSTDTPSDRADEESSDPVAAHVHAEAHPQGSEAEAAAARDMDGYDAVLAAVPAPLAVGALVAVFSSLSVPLALGAGSLVAAGIVGWALFFASPV
jgi:hypothetical protein